VVIAARMDANIALMVFIKNKTSFVSLFVCLFIWSCSDEPSDIAINSISWSEDSCSYAQNFAIQYSKEGESRLLIFASTKRKDTVSYFYKGKRKLTENSSYVKIDTGLVFASMASNYVGFLDALGMTDMLGWVDETDYINSKRVRKKINEGTIKECGSGDLLNYELLIANKPLIIAYEISGEENPIFEKCKKLGINTINCTDFKEKHPLGRAEWLKVFAWLTNQENEGVLLFTEIEEHYNATKYFCSGLRNKPQVFSGSLFNGTWNISGGNSFLGTLIEDAGGQYMYAKDTTKLNFVFSFEDVYTRCKNADVWLNPNAYSLLDNLKSEDTRYALFNAFQKGRVYNNNKIVNHQGGNGVWEMGVVRPDIVLKDLAICFYPELMSKETTIFYQALE
jgi:iron complex transport system substrate-binding protein